MTIHLTNDQLNNYVHQTLTDAERETMDRHLTDCAACRARLDGYETLQRRIHYGLLAELRDVNPSPQLSYAAITPHLKHSRRITMVVRQSNQFVYGTLTLALLMAVGVSLYFFVSNLSRPNTMLEEVKPATAAPVIVKQAVITPTVAVKPTVNPTVEVSQSLTSPVEFVMSITGDPNPLSGPISVAVDAQDNLYVIDANNARIQKFAPDGQFLTMWGKQGAGDGEFSFTSGGNWYGGIAVDGQGQVYVADPENQRIQKFDSNGQFLAKWGGHGMQDGQFIRPTDVAVDGQGNVYVTDDLRHDIQKFDSNGKFVTKWGSLGSDNGQFNQPLSLTATKEGFIYVADLLNFRIQKFDDQGQFLAKWGKGSQFMNLNSLADDEQGNLYITDVMGTHVQKFDPNGQLLSEWGSFGTEDNQFIEPADVAVDSQGNVYVADRGNNHILKFRQPVVKLTAAVSQPTVEPRPVGELVWKLEGEGQNWGTGAVANGLIYIGNSDGQFYALEAQTGQERWRFKTKGPADTTVVAVADGVVYFGSYDKYLYALDSQTGEEKWKFKSKSDFPTPAVANGLVYVGSNDLHALDVQTGEEKWRFETAGLTRGAPVVTDGVVYMASGAAESYVYAVEAQSGQEKWQTRVEGVSRGPFPLAVTDELLFASNQDYVHALERDTGQVKWQLEVRWPVLTAGNEMVYLSSADGYVYAAEAQTGQEQWKFKTGETGAAANDLTLAEGVLYVGSDDHYLYALNSQSGQEQWKFKTGRAVTMWPTFGEGIVYFSSFDGYLYAVWAGEATAADKAE